MWRQKSIDERAAEYFNNHKEIDVKEEKEKN